MDITPKISAKKNIIESYGEKGIEIKKQFYQNTIILDPTTLKEITVISLDHFLENDIFSYLNQNDEILIIGTGKKHLIIDSGIKKKIKEQFKNISISEMSSDSACRTYNILAGEERSIKALIKCQFDL